MLLRSSELVWGLKKLGGWNVENETMKILRFFHAKRRHNFIAFKWKEKVSSNCLLFQAHVVIKNIFVCVFRLEEKPKKKIVYREKQSFMFYKQAKLTNRGS